MIRGRQIRQGLPGLKGMSLSDFCDLVWLEIWDDCPPMGDHAKYREAIHTIFIEGKEVNTIEVIDPRTGEVKHVSASGPNREVDVHRPIPKRALSEYEQLKQAIADAQKQEE